jgi:hypothetical protein
MVARLQDRWSEADLEEQDRETAAVFVQLAGGLCRYQAVRPVASSRRLIPELRESVEARCKRDGAIPSMCACMLKAWEQRYTDREVKALALSEGSLAKREQSRVLLWCSENRDKP